MREPESFGIERAFWKQTEKEKGKNERAFRKVKVWEKGEDVLMMGICVWWTKCKRIKKKRKRMDERKGKE